MAGKPSQIIKDNVDKDMIEFRKETGQLNIELENITILRVNNIIKYLDELYERGKLGA